MIYSAFEIQVAPLFFTRQSAEGERRPGGGEGQVHCTGPDHSETQPSRVSPAEPGRVESSRVRYHFCHLAAGGRLTSELCSLVSTRGKKLFEKNGMWYQEMFLQPRHFLFSPKKILYSSQLFCHHNIFPYIFRQRKQRVMCGGTTVTHDNVPCSGKNRSHESVIDIIHFR